MVLNYKINAQHKNKKGNLIYHLFSPWSHREDDPEYELLTSFLEDWIHFRSRSDIKQKVETIVI
jgi:hypothetical protein